MGKSSIELNSKTTLDKLLKTHALYDMYDAAEITGYHYRYLRRLCHAKKIDHQRILGRYYMTPADVAKLLSPVAATVTASPKK